MPYRLDVHDVSLFISGILSPSKSALKSSTLSQNAQAARIPFSTPSITSGVRVIPPIIAARAIACACFDALPARYAILAAARRASISAITIFRLSLSLALPPMMYSTS